jgi:D-psicose/D-tagatose/L-ribulose 3-epimerase
VYIRLHQTVRKTARYTDRMAVRSRFALCNEVFQTWPFERALDRMRSFGYEGVEIAPFTLGEDPAAISSAHRNAIRRSIESSGLCFTGLHWLLVAPPGLHMTTRDNALRRRTWDYVYRLIDLCADLSLQPGAVMVFGSPRQRSTMGEMTAAEATSILASELAAAAPRAESCGVKLLLEALPTSQTDVVTSLAEAASIVSRIGNPAVRTMFDAHNAVDESEPHTDLIRRYFPFIAHVHVNELDGREPGMGNYDFAGLLATLAGLDYAGWISVEAFDFTRDPERIASRAITTLRAAMPSQVQTI